MKYKIIIERKGLGFDINIDSESLSECIGLKILCDSDPSA
jgi:hypothetical protein